MWAQKYKISKKKIVIIKSKFNAVLPVRFVDDVTHAANFGV